MNYNCETEETKSNLDELKDNLEPKTSNLGKLKNARRGIALCLATITVLTAGTFELKNKLENDNQVLGLRREDGCEDLDRQRSVYMNLILLK